jgi:hypothetical protein
MAIISLRGGQTTTSSQDEVTLLSSQINSISDIVEQLDLNQLGDVTVASAVEGELLVYDGAEWVNSSNIKITDNNLLLWGGNLDFYNNTGNGSVDFNFAGRTNINADNSITIRSNNENIVLNANWGVNVNRLAMPWWLDNNNRKYDYEMTTFSNSNGVDQAWQDVSHNTALWADGIGVDDYRFITHNHFFNASFTDGYRPMGQFRWGLDNDNWDGPGATNFELKLRYGGALERTVLQAIVDDRVWISPNGDYSNPQLDVRYEVVETNRQLRLVNTTPGAVTSPALGALIFDTTDNKAKCWDGTTWQALF